MAITTKRKFDKHVEISRNYLDGIRELEEPEKEIYSHEEPESVEGMTEKIKVDERDINKQKKKE